MKKDSALHEKTSRRAFTKSVVATLAAAPIAASMLSCGNRGGPTEGPSTATPTPGSTPSPTSATATTAGPKKTSCDFPGPEEHIPPMDVNGGGSLTIESKNKLDTQNPNAPFTYTETDITNPAQQRFGDLHKVRVITDIASRPFVLDDFYTGLPSGCQLLLYYQNIKTPPPLTDLNDVTYDPFNFQPDDPDVRIVGGAGGTNVFRIVVKSKRLSNEKSHKRIRPNRYRHDDGSGLARHFRIGQWRIVDRNGVTIPGFEDNGAENYHFYLTFNDFQP